MPLRLDLAALTDEELQALLGHEQALLRLPELSRARLEGRRVPGAAVVEALAFAPRSERAWGATPEQSRALGSLHQTLTLHGAQEQGVFYLPLYSEVRHARAYTYGPDCSVLLRWSETPEAGSAPYPFVQLLTWLRDRSTGLACVLTSGAPNPVIPSPSEELDFHHQPGLDAGELMAAHAQHVLRQGRTQKLAPDVGWQTGWQEAHALNLAAWTRRGVVYQDSGPSGPDSRT